MLSNAYFLAKFRFDTAENEPAKNLQKFANFADRVRTNIGCRCTRRNGQPRLADGIHISADYMSLEDQFYLDTSKLSLYDATYGEHPRWHSPLVHHPT